MKFMKFMKFMKMCITRLSHPLYVAHKSGGDSIPILEISNNVSFGLWCASIALRPKDS